MPIYEYTCRACGHTEEILQKIDGLMVQDCPQCGRPEFIRPEVSAAAFHLKGTGWYKSDYAKPSSSLKSPPSESQPSEKAPSSDVGKKDD
jgi:putative FmdB family regulatory protein